ncbi:minor capsid protein [Lactobacillus corticis]|uniref:Phage head morphogenesis domain-containing protein n=1 Tax=Lactobacillus corticis TaxID=2201249 RepID=A0A916QGM0_9LACO|nr:hypothetical protein LCB40_04990 [Lactobacillus corticis]
MNDIANKQLHRLVITEMGHAAEQATAQFYKDSDIEQYQYLATLESHTCDQCAHLDERIFYVKDKVEGLNYPLIHPYCRCTTVPYIKDLPDVQSRWYRGKDGKGHWMKNKDSSQNSNSLSFSEWKKMQNLPQLSMKLFRALPSGALNESMPNGRIRMDEHAKRYYQELRNSDRDNITNKIVKSTKLSTLVVSSALGHILDSKYSLRAINGGRKIQHFYPDYDMAQSLQRLLLNETLEHDIIMLKHEALEAHYMDDLGMFYEDAHRKANETYNYQKALLEYRKRRNKS